ncbi:unnamed protein product [Rodentolepis nana]|uniref:Uncharacterized protein n=1 Tax=Rodentolepis nana TaxID=102285 RepID=A0A0R3THS7_RODNA|nr:unnamed protein product [Rodentolepis nana]
MPPTASTASDKSPLRFHCLKLERPSRFTEAIYSPRLLYLRLLHFFYRSLLLSLIPALALRFATGRVSR